MSDDAKTAKSPQQQVMDIFLVPGSQKCNTDELHALSKSLPELLTNAAKGFISNFEGAISIVCFPTTLAMASAQEWRYRQLLIAERIRHGTSSISKPDSPAEKEARMKADQRFAEEMNSQEQIENLGESACMFLLAQHSQANVAEAAADLLRQGIVLMWSAFELLARDVFEIVVNCRPDLGLLLLDTADGKRLFQIKAIDLDTLSKYSFDLSKSMGSILSECRDLSDLASIKSVLNGLFRGETNLTALLNSPELWVLAQQRHLVVHNRGIVDRKYLHQTGSTLAEGERLLLRPSDVEKSFGMIKNLGLELLTNAGNAVLNA